MTRILAVTAILFEGADAATLPGASEIAKAVSDVILAKYPGVWMMVSGPTPVEPRPPVSIDKWRVKKILNIRTAADLKAPIVGCLAVGDTVAELERDGNWVRHARGWSHVSGLEVIYAA